MSEQYKVPTVKLVDGKGKKIICNVSDKSAWEANGYYVEGSKLAPAPKKTTKKKTTKKWGKDNG